ncbi:hypothetical protein, partial [Pantoea sp. 18069]|uniref:hypothetical protein n=1 Tax=Pantoea sp. 18069 TaxID=2681415 RepID=UPI00135CABA2
MDVDHQQRLVQALLEVVALAGELGDVQRFGAVGISLGATLDGRQSGQIGDFALAAPGAQRRRVNALSAHQRAYLAGLRAVVGSLQNAAFVGVGERTAARSRDYLGVGGRLGRCRCARIGQILHCVHRDLG